MTTKDIKVGRFRLTPEFANRAFKRYARRIRQKAMPTEAVQGELMSPEWFGEAVNTKASHLLHEIGGYPRKEVLETVAAEPAVTMPERETHAAMQRAADEYGYGVLPVPEFPEDEKLSEQPEGGEGEEGEGKPTDSEGKKSSSKSKKKKSPDSKPSKEKSEGGESAGDEKKDGEGEADGESEGEGDGSESDGGSPGGGQDGEDSEDGDGNAGADRAGDADAEAEEQPEGEKSDKRSEGSGGKHINGGSGDEYTEGAETEVNGGDGSPEDEKLSEPIHLNLHEQRMEFSDLVEPEPPILEKTQLKRWKSFGGRQPDVASGNQIMARIRNELMAYSRHRYSRDKDSGDVDFTKLVDLAQGTNLDRVFYTMTHAKRINACVQLLLDGSGSMACNNRIGTTAKLAYLICSVLEKMRVPCQVLMESGYAYLVKDWHEKLDQSRVHQILSDGGNCVPHSMTMACEVLAKRREQRHIQIITTDGDIGWTTAKTREFYRGMTTDRMEGETDADHIARTSAMAGQQSVAAYGYSGDAGPGKKYTAAQLEANLHQLYKNDPRLRTYGFGIEIDVPPGLFHRTFNRLRPDNMTEVIIETLGRVLTHE